MSLFLSVLSVLLAWTGFILKFQLLFFFSTRTIIVRLKQNAYYFIVLAWVLVLLNYLFTFTNDTIPAIVLVALATKEEDLEQILVTERAYWYSWSKFNPNTSIYNGSLP